MNSVSVTRKGEARIRSGHPWIFTSDIANRANIEPGSTVRVTTERGKPLGVAHFSSTSQITLRMLDTRPVELDATFFRSRLEAAAALRQRLQIEGDAYRLVYAEGDLLPGLIVDRYGDYLAAQFLSQGMDRIRYEIAEALVAVTGAKGIVARHDVSVRKLEALSLEPEVLAGEVPDRVRVRMNGLTWDADLHHGQKTGVYLDQRENYLAAARWGRGKALDCFTSSGGFALHLAKTCETVEAVDSGEDALQSAARNVEANGIQNVELREANVFDLLSGYIPARRRFDTIVLDPPAFAKNKKSMDAALRGYKELNYKALRLLNPGGTLVTCSCSHHLSEADLLELVAAAALDTGRTIRVLERRSQAQDHPILLTVPETLYLKCLILQAL